MAAIAGLVGAAAGVGAGLFHQTRVKAGFDKALAAASANPATSKLPAPEEVAAANERENEIDAIAAKLAGLPITDREAHSIAARLQGLLGKLKSASGKDTNQAITRFVADIKSKYLLSDADAQRLQQVVTECASQSA
jgi:hypothetical protein